MILRKSLNFITNYFHKADDGLIYLDNTIVLKRNFIQKYIRVIINFFQNKKNKFKKISILFFIFDFCCFILSLILFPLAVLLFMLDYKISTTDNKTVGYHFEEIFFLFCYCKVKNINTKKIIIFSPIKTAANKYIDQFYFAKKFIVINKFIYGFIIVPLSQWNFLKADIFFIKNKDYYILPKQIYKNYQKFIQRKIFVKQQLMHDYYQKFFQNKKINFFNETNYLKKIKRKELSKFDINKKTKIALIKIRESKNSNYRNSEINKLIPSINYLIKKKYLIFRIIDQNSKKLNIKKKNYIELDIQNDFGKKINALLMSRYDVFIGNISGLYNWSTSIFFSKRNIFIDCVNFFEKNFSNKKNIFLFKTVKNKKNGKIIPLRNIQFKYREIYKIYSEEKIKSLSFINNGHYKILKVLKKNLKNK